MPCLTKNDWINFVADGKISETAKKHLQNCDKCKSKANEFENVIVQTKTNKSLSPTQKDYWEQLHNSIMDEISLIDKKSKYHTANYVSILDFLFPSLQRVVLHGAFIFVIMISLIFGYGYYSKTNEQKITNDSFAWFINNSGFYEIIDFPFATDNNTEDLTLLDLQLQETDVVEYLEEVFSVDESLEYMDDEKLNNFSALL